MADLPSKEPVSDEDAAYFRLIADNIPPILWMFDETGTRPVYVSKAFERISGRPIKTLYADPDSWRELLHPDDRVRVNETLGADHLAEHNIEFRFVRPDGEVRWIWARGVPLPEVDGEPRRLVGIAEDITAFKQAESGLERSVSLLRATVDATFDGVVALDHDRRITIFDRRFVEMWKVPDFEAIELAHRRFPLDRMLAQLRDPDEFLAAMDKAEEQPAMDTLERVAFKDGRVFESASRPQRIGERIVGRVWSFRDITAQARAQAALRAHTEQLELRNKVLLKLARLRIAEPEDAVEAFHRITETAAEVLTVERVGIWLFDEERRQMRLDDLFERSTDQHTSGHVLSRDATPSYFAALDTERTIAAEDVRADDRTRELVESYAAPLGVGAMLDAPVRAGGDLAGVVCFEHVGAPRNWSVEDQSFAGSIADLVSIAIEARHRQEAEWGMRFMAKASSILNSSLDYQTTIDNVAKLVIPDLAEWCIVDVVEDGTIRRATSAHRDEQKEPVLAELGERYPPDWDSPHSATRVIASGEPEFTFDVNDQLIRDHTVDAGHADLIKQLGIQSFMALPLVARGDVFGAITLSRADRRYGPNDIKLATDIAGRIATAIDNARLHEGTQAASKAKSDFLAVMSHELRTPLTAILGYTELIATGVSGPVNEKQRDQLHRITLRTEELLRIIEELLAFTQTEAGRERTRVQLVDLNELLEDVASTAKPLADERGLSFELDTPRPITLRTDPDHLRRILLDLLDNAVRFTNEGGVRLEAESSDGAVRIDVVDTGIGVGPDQQGRIFEPFVQVEDTLTREKGGTGLGLAVARRLARLLGGDVTVRSEPGEGSTFTVELPLRAAEKPAGKPD